MAGRRIERYAWGLSSRGIEAILRDEDGDLLLSKGSVSQKNRASTINRPNNSAGLPEAEPFYTNSKT